MVFDRNFSIKLVRYSRATIRFIVMMKILIRRAKRRLLYRKWISSKMLRKFGHHPTRLIVPFLWKSKCDLPTYFDNRFYNKL